MQQHLFLIGFMGAGKTTVGQPLAQRLDCPFVDLDQRIEAAAGRSIPEIFAESGEGRFREMETRQLELLGEATPAVVSTGGGIIGREANRNLMHKLGTTVYLHAEWQTLQRRIGDGSGRPLAQSEGGWEKTRTLWEQRLPLYRLADITILTDDRTVESIVDEIEEHAKLSL